MAAPKSITPFTMLVGAVFAGSLLWLVLSMVCRFIAKALLR